jgi:hypothetical protein
MYSYSKCPPKAEIMYKCKKLNVKSQRAVSIPNCNALSNGTHGFPVSSVLSAANGG